MAKLKEKNVEIFGLFFIILFWGYIMRFSIVITTFNEPGYLTEAIESCFNQTYKEEPFEVIVIDDNSNTCTRAVLFDRPDIDLIYVKNEKNLGLVKSHNLGVYYASGEWIIRLDHDDKLIPDALQKLSDFINNNINSKIGFIYSDLRIMNTGKIRKYPEWKSGSILDLQDIGHLQCYRRDKTLEIGGWDTTLFYSSDTDFIIRLIEHSVKIIHIPEVLVENRLHERQRTVLFTKQGGDTSYWKNLIFNRAIQKHPDLWIEGRQNVIMQTAGSQLWRSEALFIRGFVENNVFLKSGNIADIGCNNKKKLNYSVGIDLDRCGGKVPELVLNVPEELPFKDDFLDGIVASHIIEHVNNPVKVIEGWLKKLKVGGILMLIVPHKQYIPNIGTPEGDPTHIADYLPINFKELVLDKLETKFELLSFDKINNNWSFDCFIQKL